MTKPSILLSIPKGTTYRKTFIWKTGPEAGPYTPVDLTGYTGRIHFREDILSSTISLSIVTGTSSLVFSGNTGTITVLLTPEQSNSLPTNGVYDIEVTTGAGEISRPFGGTYNAFRGVTHD